MAVAIPQTKAYQNPEMKGFLQTTQEDEDVFEGPLQSCKKRSRHPTSPANCSTAHGPAKTVISRRNSSGSKKSLDLDKRSSLDNLAGANATLNNSHSFLSSFFIRRKSDETSNNSKGKRALTKSLSDSQRTHSEQNFRTVFELGAQANTQKLQFKVRMDSLGFGCTVKGEGPVTVGQVVKDGPAYKVGIKTGDKILKLDGEDVSKCSHKDVLNMVLAKYRSQMHALKTQPPPKTCEVSICFDIERMVKHS